MARNKYDYFSSVALRAVKFLKSWSFKDENVLTAVTFMKRQRPRKYVRPALTPQAHFEVLTENY